MLRDGCPGAVVAELAQFMPLLHRGHGRRAPSGAVTLDVVQGVDVDGGSLKCMCVTSRIGSDEGALLRRHRTEA
jgi:hypothetical protein